MEIRSNYKHLINYFSDFKSVLDLELHKDMNKEMDVVNITKFFELLSIILSLDYTFNDEVNIAIVTHSHFMVHNHISEGKNKPNNNAIFKVSYKGSIDDMASIHASPINKTQISKIYNGCSFKSTKKKLYCNIKNKSCQKKPIETSKNIIDVLIEKYTSLNNIKLF